MGRHTRTGEFDSGFEKELVGLLKRLLQRFIGWRALADRNADKLNSTLTRLEPTTPGESEELLKLIQDLIRMLVGWREAAERAIEDLKIELMRFEDIAPDAAEEDGPGRPSSARRGLGRRRGTKGGGLPPRALDRLVHMSGGGPPIWVAIAFDDLPPMRQTLLLTLAADGESAADGLVPWKQLQEIAISLGGPHASGRGVGALRELIHQLRNEFHDRGLARLLIETSHGRARLRLKSYNAQTPDTAASVVLSQPHDVRDTENFNA